MSAVKILEKVITCESLLSARTGEPLVNLFLGNEQAQMTVEQARELAMNILAAAEGAETDAMLLHLAKSLGDVEVGVSMIRAMREFRAERQAGMDKGEGERS
jgi:hypothetical protein